MPALEAQAGGSAHRPSSESPAYEHRFEIVQKPNGSWYATYYFNGNTHSGSGEQDSPQDALKWALPLDLFQAAMRNA